jgi:hypothetical protein
MISFCWRQVSTVVGLSFKPCLLALVVWLAVSEAGRKQLMNIICFDLVLNSSGMGKKDSSMFRQFKQAPDIPIILFSVLFFRITRLES